ncbi:peptidoglycan-binding domain-containing protein [Streptomyces collinus]|uniref:peptidoglycan-binding domain-containing protein n=1 Tax=Streptomyces collinus TaxID=42684 RepID=UPI0033B66982
MTTQLKKLMPVRTEVRRTHIFAVLTAAAALMGGGVAAAPSATAASASCSTYTTVYQGSYSAWVPSTGGGSVNCIMGSGSSGDGVQQLQYTLYYCYGLDTGGIDGVYGAKTATAVRTVQSRNGLSPDGIYGPDTRNAMLWRFNDFSNPSSRYCSRF